MYILGLRANPLKTLTDLSEELQISKRTLQRRIAEFEQEKERYGKYLVIHDGGVVLVNFLAFTDFLYYRKQLLEKNARKYVPMYEPAKVAHELGLYDIERS